MTASACIRLGVVDDVPKILALDRATPEAPHWAKAVYSSYVERGSTALQKKALFVAILEDDLQGFAAASLVADEAELESIAVGASSRRSGLGSSLLDAVKHWSRLHQAHTLRLEVRAGNAAAQAFYRTEGFLQEGRRRAYYKTPVDDAVLLRLDLRSDRQKTHDGEL